MCLTRFNFIFLLRETKNKIDLSQNTLWYFPIDARKKTVNSRECLNDNHVLRVLPRCDVFDLMEFNSVYRKNRSDFFHAILRSLFSLCSLENRRKSRFKSIQIDYVCLPFNLSALTIPKTYDAENSKTIVFDEREGVIERRVNKRLEGKCRTVLWPHDIVVCGFKGVDVKKSTFL